MPLTIQQRRENAKKRFEETLRKLTEEEANTPPPKPKKKRCVVHFLHSGEKDPLYKEGFKATNVNPTGEQFVRDWPGFTVAEVGTHKEGKHWYLLEKLHQGENFNVQNIWEITNEHWSKNAKRFTMLPKVSFKSIYSPYGYCHPDGFEAWAEIKTNPDFIATFDKWFLDRL